MCACVCLSYLSMEINPHYFMEMKVDNLIEILSDEKQSERDSKKHSENVNN
jgi:hypothetical protein